MPPLAELKIRIAYTGGLADKNALPAYDGATSIDGMTRALHIIMHAYMTGEVVSRATALKGASIILKPIRQGSFIYELIVFIESFPATSGVAAALSGPVVYDFIKTAIKRATGSLDAEPKTSTLKRLYERKEPPKLNRPPADLDELAETLEGSLQDAHRPIGDEGTVRRISIGSTRQELVILDDITKDWVNTSEEATGVEVFHGNVTRFNSISRSARAFVKQLGRVVPMRPNGDFPAGGLPLLTWSLHGSNINSMKNLELHARRVRSASGRTKRLLLSDYSRAVE